MVVCVPLFYQPWLKCGQVQSLRNRLLVAWLVLGKSLLVDHKTGLFIFNKHFGDGGLVSSTRGKLRLGVGRFTLEHADHTENHGTKEHGEKCNSDTGSNTHKDRDDNICRDVCKNITPRLLGGLVDKRTVLEVVGRLVLTLTMTVMGLATVTMALTLTLHSVAALTLELALDILPGIVDHALGAAPHITVLWCLLAITLDLDASDDDLANRSLDELYCDRRDAVDKTVSDFDDPDFDVDNLEMLILIDSFRTNSQAISQSTHIALAIGLDNSCRQVSVPRVGVRIEFEAV